MKKVTETPDWPQILKQLSKSRIDFLVVGGGALVLHGIPRTTMDIDIYVPADDLTLSELDNILKSKLNLKSSNEFTFSSIKQAELLIGQWLSFAIPNGPEIVDVFFCRKGEFYKLHDSADIIEIENEPIYVADLETLKKMKIKSGRPIDLADVALIDEYKELFD